MSRQFGWIALLCGALAWGVPALAQAKEKGGRTPVRIGPKLGLGLASLAYDNDDMDDPGDSRLGMSIGAQLDLQLIDMLALQLELLYGMRGESFNSALVNTTTRYDYLYVPVVLVGTYPISEQFKPRLTAGLSVGYMLSGAVTTENASASNSSVKVELDPGQFRRGEVGLVLGLGAELPLAGQSFTFDLRWERGLTGIADRPSGSDNVRNSVVLLAVGVMFNLI